MAPRIRRWSTSTTDRVNEPRTAGSPTLAASRIPRRASKASPLGRIPTGTLVRESSAPGGKMPTVSSPRFEVNARSRSSETRTPATAARPLIEETYAWRAQSITSTASFAVCATYSRSVRAWIAAWSNPPGVA